MQFQLPEEAVRQIKELLKSKNIKISTKEITCKLEQVVKSQDIFPVDHQQALLVQLLHGFDKSKRKEFIVFQELGEGELPARIVLGVAAEDWTGMSNAILGIVHHKEGNVSFVKGFTVKYKERSVGIMVLCFILETMEKYEQFKQEKRDIVAKIREAAHGTSGKAQFLEDETIKFEIYNRIINRLMDSYSHSGLIKVIEESGEMQKFISSRSREYLEERSIKDLANLIVNNYIYQNMIRSGVADEVIKIKNMSSKRGELTGITFVCREGWISIEDFLMSLNHSVPDHIIKHHKSFVTADGILVYRIEIVDRHEKPLNAGIIKEIEKSMEKLVAIAHSDKFAKLKAIGGFEHYARAIIPFLREELKKTGMTQVFIDMARKSEFHMDIKLVLVSTFSQDKRIYDLSSKVCLVPGVTIRSVIPTKVHGDSEINILKLKVNLSEFESIKDLYKSLKTIIRKIYGDIRDFDEGFRDIYISRLNLLLERLDLVNPALIREIFFNIDELYKIEMRMNLLEELIKLCFDAIEQTRKKPGEQVIFKYKNVTECDRTLVVVSYETQKRLMSTLITELKDVELYFTKIEWNQRSYLLMVLSKDKRPVDMELIKWLKTSVKQFVKKKNGNVGSKTTPK